MKPSFRSAAIGLILALASVSALAQQPPYAWDVTVTNANGAGSITLLPYGSITIDGGVHSGPTLFMPSPWNCISSVASSPMTILEFE
jgi:hypothetical protein